MCSKSKHVLRSHRSYKQRQREAGSFLNYCYIKSIKKSGNRSGFINNLFRRKVITNE